MEWTGKKEIIQEDFTQEKKIVLAREDDLVYSCLDLNPKAVSQLQDETGLPSGSLLKSLYYLTAKDLAQRSLAELLYPHRKEVGIKARQYMCFGHNNKKSGGKHWLNI